jgi:hypothetical protein
LNIRIVKQVGLLDLSVPVLSLILFLPPLLLQLLVLSFQLAKLSIEFFLKLLFLGLSGASDMFTLVALD